MQIKENNPEERMPVRMQAGFSAVQTNSVERKLKRNQRAKFASHPFLAFS